MDPHWINIHFESRPAPTRTGNSKQSFRSIGSVDPFRSNIGGLSYFWSIESFTEGKHFLKAFMNPDGACSLWRVLNIVEWYFAHALSFKTFPAKVESPEDDYNLNTKKYHPSTVTLFRNQITSSCPVQIKPAQKFQSSNVLWRFSVDSKTPPTSPSYRNDGSGPPQSIHPSGWSTCHQAAQLDSYRHWRPQYPQQQDDLGLQYHE